MITGGGHGVRQVAAGEFMPRAPFTLRALNLSQVFGPGIRTAFHNAIGNCLNPTVYHVTLCHFSTLRFLSTCHRLPLHH